MPKKFKLISAGLILTIKIFADQSSQSLLEGNLDKFIAHVVAAEDQPEFRLFYNKLILTQEKRKESSKQREQKRYREKITRLQQLGKSSLENKNPILANDFKRKSEDTIKRKIVHRFYSRYGAYEEFLKNKFNNQKSILAKTKSYVRDAGNKVTAWFGNLRKPKTATT